MDLNLTGLIWGMPFSFVGQIEEEASLLSNTSLFMLLGIVIGWLLNLTSSAIQEKQKNRIENLQKKKQTYSQFMGIKASTSQLYFTRRGILATYYWLQARDRLALDKLPDYGTIADFDRRLESSEIELAKNQRDLGGTLGLIEVSFLPSPKLDQLIKSFFEKAALFQSTNVKFREKFRKANPCVIG